MAGNQSATISPDKMGECFQSVQARFERRRESLIPVLQHVQACLGYLPVESLAKVASFLRVPASIVYGVTTFYAQFYMEPRGKHILKVCLGTACYILGGKEILDYISGELGVKPGRMTSDGLFTLETVACLGCCGMGPVVAVDDKLYGNCDIQSMNTVLDRYRAEVQA